MNPTLSPVYDAATVGKLLGVIYTAEQRAAIDQFLKVMALPVQSPEPLNGFITFFDPGWSIIRLRDHLRREEIIHPQLWYEGKAFAATDWTPCYRQVRPQPFPQSPTKSWLEELALLPEDEEVPTARVVVMALTIHLLATGERPLRDMHVRCSDSLHQSRVYVSHFFGRGLIIGDVWNDHRRHPALGLASARKIRK